MTKPRTFVIVGAGLAGATAAQTLRAQGFDERVVIIGSEQHRPYQRPPLSKDYVRGEAGPETLFVHGEDFYAEHDIDLRLGVAATGLDTARREVTLEDRSHVQYDRLLIATGARPRRLLIPGGELDGIFYLRTLDDSDKLRERIDRGGKLVVVGAGWIGTEIAASARARGMDVTVLDPAQVPLERVLGGEVGGIYRDVHTNNGVRMELGTGVRAFEGSYAVQGALTSDGRSLECDAVVVGVGAQPRTSFAVQGGLDVDNGILVNAQLEASAPDVFAAGDAANAFHPFYDEHVRVEHSANAENQGKIAALNMLGGAEVYSDLPCFFSDQFDVGMEYSGLATSWDKVVFRGDPATREFLAFWLKDSHVVAAMNVNIWDVTDQLRALIRGRTVVDSAALADPTVPLDQLTASAEACNA